MSSVITELKHELKRELKLPTARQAIWIFVSILAIGTLIAILQGVVRPLVSSRFALDSASFPWVVGSFERAGSYWNLVGWGYFLNDHRIDSLTWWLVEMMGLFAFLIAFARLLWWGPVAMLAGVVANLLEWRITGHVLDWIVFPNGAEGVRALSLGDIGIYGGSAVCSVAVSLMWIRAVRCWWSILRASARTNAHL